MDQVKACVFDIGNVLMSWEPDRLYAQLVPDAAKRAALFDEVDLNGMNERIDLGAPFRQTVYDLADATPDRADLIRAWHDRWFEMFGPPITGSWRILQKLRAGGMPVFALSNFGNESFVMAEEHHPELAEFDRRYISGQLGVIKPDPEIYQIVERDSGLSGGSLFFIDDRADNIAAAAERGWQTHLFTGADGLEVALHDAGVAI
ncbi:HAD family hydrolase [Halovulum sp. GXIMD14793]